MSDKAEDRKGQKRNKPTTSSSGRKIKPSTKLEQDYGSDEEDDDEEVSDTVEK